MRIKGVEVEEWPGGEDGMCYVVSGGGEAYIAQDGRIWVRWCNDYYWFQKAVLAVRQELHKRGLVE